MRTIIQFMLTLIVTFVSSCISTNYHQKALYESVYTMDYRVPEAHVDIHYIQIDSPFVYADSILFIYSHSESGFGVDRWSNDSHILEYYYKKKIMILSKKVHRYWGSDLRQKIISWNIKKTYY